MKVAGAGRILLWNGGSLWIGRSGEPAGFHAHHAVQISLALTGEGLRLRTPEVDWTAYPAAIVAANQEHAFEGGGDFVAMIFVEPESREGQILQQRCAAEGICSVANDALAHERSALLAAYENNVGDAALIETARAAIATLTTTMSPPQATLDPRIRRALDYIRARIKEESIQLAEVAAVAHLSPDRFRHLFLEQTGIRFRPYVLWLRMELALAAYASHHDLTEAAQAGGFADSAHLSRSFKSMFGIAPSSLLID